MHPFLQRLKAAAADEKRRLATAQAFANAAQEKKRQEQWEGLRRDLGMILGQQLGPDGQELLSSMAPERVPEWFWFNHGAAYLLLHVQGHAPIGLHVIREGDRWRPNNTARRPLWVVEGGAFEDLGAALLAAEDEYQKDPDRWEAQRLHQALEEDRAAEQGLPPPELREAAGPAAPAPVEAPPAAVPMAVVTGELPPDVGQGGAAELGRWEGGGEIDPNRPSRKKKGGPHP